MDELDEARLELSRLEQTERELLEHLSDIRCAAESQQSIILSSRPDNASPIGDLPAEILLRVLDLHLQNALDPASDAYLIRKRDLAGVSQHWKNIVLGCPKFWTSIDFTPKWLGPTLLTHLEKSGQCLVDIKVHSWGRNCAVDDDILIEMLDALVSHAHRWRSLVIRDDVSRSFLDRILERLDQVTFPSLTCVSIIEWARWLDREGLRWDDLFRERVDHYPRFLWSNGCPRLKCLELSDFIIPDDIQAPPSLTTLALELSHFSHSIFFQSSLSQQLTSLSLFRGLYSLPFILNSIHFPLLEELVLRITGVGHFLAAIIAPKLRHIDYIPLIGEQPFSVVFVHLQSKFSTVQYISLELPILDMDPPNAAQLVCMAFPNVLHAELSLDATLPFFKLRDGSRAVNYWGHVQTLTLKARTDSLPWRVPEYFLEWLNERMDRGFPKLVLRVLQIGAAISYRGTPLLSSDSLDDYCILEVENVPVWRHWKWKMYVLLISSYTPTIDSLYGMQRLILLVSVNSRGRAAA
ncbi:hypothetical protein V8B97DRAFT_1896839 [Scleroderma yunnanense]